MHDRLTPAEVDARAKTVASRPPVDRWDLAALIVLSTAPEDVGRRHGYSTQAASDLAQDLRDVLVTKILDPSFADPDRFASGASYSGWLRQTAESLVLTLQRRATRGRARHGEVFDPALMNDLHAAPPATETAAAVALEGHALDAKNVGPLERLHSAAIALSQGLGIPPLPARRWPVQDREYLLSLVAGEPGLAQRVAFDLEHSGTSAADPLLVQAISALGDRLDDWATGDPEAVDALARFAFSPTPQPAEAAIVLAADALAGLYVDTPTAKDQARRLLRAWASAIADVVGSEFSAHGPPRLKSDLEIAADVTRFTRAAQRYIDGGGPHLGRSVHEISRSLSWNVRRAVRHHRAGQGGPFTFETTPAPVRRFSIVPPLAG